MHDEDDARDHAPAVEDLISSAMSALSHSALIGDADGRVVRHGNVLGSTATLANCAIGAGVLATPFAVSKFGTVAGGIIIFVTALLVAYTLVVLVRAGSVFSSASYQGVVKDAFGPSASRAVSATLVVYLFGSCVAYLIIIGDSYTKAVAALAGGSDGAWWASRHFAIAVVATFFVTPLSLLREMSRLAPASAVALVSLAYTAAAIMCKGFAKVDDWAPKAVAFKLDADSVSAVPIIVFAFQCHIQVLAIFSELSAHASDADENAESLDALDDELVERKRVRRMHTVIALAVGACFVGYLLVGEFAYASHPNVSSNVLDSYDKGDAAMVVATIFMGFSAIASFPVNHHAARAALDDLLAATFGWEECAPGQAPISRHATQTFGFVLTTTLVAFAVTDLGEVFQLIGATCGSLVMFVIPALLLLHPRMRSKKDAGTRAMDDDLQGLDDVTRELLSSAHELLQSDLDDDLDFGDDERGSSSSPKNLPGPGTCVIAATLILFAAFVAVSNVYVLFFRK